MLESDDYNAFHGGMIAAVRSLSGKAPKSFCGNLSQKILLVFKACLRK